MSAIKQLPFVDEAIELENSLVGQGEALQAMQSAVYALNNLKEEMEDALAMDPTGINGLLGHASKNIMHSLRNVNFLIHAHTEKLEELHVSQKEQVDTLLLKVEGDKGE